jgi:hypothetical protein
MSLTTMALSTRNHPAAPAFHAAATTAPTTSTTTVTTNTVTDAINKVAKFIPGDLLTIYLSGLAAIRTAFPNAAAVCPAAGAPNAVATAAPTGAPGGVSGMLSHMAGATPSISQASTLAMEIFVACLVFVPVYVIGLRFINTPAGQPFVVPYWGVLAGWIAFWIYAMGVDNIWFGCTGVNATLLIFFVSPLLAFLNEIVAKLWPEQAM